MTLVELLVVLGVIGLIVGMGVPALTAYSRQIRLKTATRQLMGLVSLARSTAISSHEEHAVVVDPESREIRVINTASGEALEPILRLPASVSLEMEVGGQSVGEPHVVFRPTGSLTGRSVSLVLSDGLKQQTIVVTGPTGAVTIQ